MINNVVLVGRLVKDPEGKTIGDGVRCLHFTVAVNRRVNGETKADFIDCTAFRATAENMEKFLNKGSLIGVEGRIQKRSYEGNNGMVYITEVVADNVQFLEPPTADRTPKIENNTLPFNDDDLPF